MANGLKYNIAYKSHALIRCLAVFYICFFCFGNAVAADDRTYKIEAAFLYNFFNYITWPEHSSPNELKNVSICIYNDDPIEKYLEYIRQKMSSERTLRIRKLSERESLYGCQLVFTSNPEIAKIISESSSEETITVASTPGFLDEGGMIELSPAGEIITMEINNSLLAKDGFQVSSRLLNLARKVR